VEGADVVRRAEHDAGVGRDGVHLLHGDVGVGGDRDAAVAGGGGARESESDDAGLAGAGAGEQREVAGVLDGAPLLVGQRGDRGFEPPAHLRQANRIALAT
jgi:hypothetical protein